MDFSYWKRFLLALVAMGAVNLLPLMATWEAYGMDGMEVVGWPLTFHERGGFSYVEHFYPLNLLGDVAFAVAVSAVAAYALRSGPISLIRKLRNWPLTDE
jgi:hypothetical protein